MRPVEETADLDALLDAGYERREPTPRRWSAVLIALAVVVAVAAVGATLLLAHAASARAGETIFVTPNAPVASPSPTAAPSAVPSQDAPGPEVPSQEPPSQEPASQEPPSQEPSAAVPGSLDDGLFVAPSQDPASNG